MSTNTSHSGTVHIRALLESALAAEAGVIVRDLKRSEAVRLRQQLHTIRSQERKKSMRLFPDGDPRQGQTAYDCLLTEIVEQPPGGVEPGSVIEVPTPIRFMLRITKAQAMAQTMKVEDISTGASVNLEDHL